MSILKKRQLSVFFAACAAGCYGAGGQDDSMPMSASSDFITSQGTRFVELKDISYFDKIDRPWAGKAVDDLTEDELAQALRGVMHHLGKTYIQTEPAYDLARKIKSGFVPMGGESFSPHIDSTPGAATDSTIANVSSAIIFGADNRAKMTSVWPYTAQIVQSATSNYNGTGKNCSATLIGRSTAITAASCEWDHVSNWYPTAKWASGVVDRVFPFGDTACASVIIPTAYITQDPPESDFTTYNYAVLEFGDCNLFPGDNTGWLGWIVASDSTIKNNPGLAFGYPTGTAYNWPSVWGMNGGVGAIQPKCSGTVGNSALKTTIIDTTNSQGGMAWYINGIPPGYNTAGLFTVGIDMNLSVSGENCGKRLDSTVANFLCANSRLCQ